MRAAWADLEPEGFIFSKKLKDLNSVGIFLYRNKGAAMSEIALYENIMSIGNGIRLCIEQKQIRAALILIYSGIDTTGWLDSKDGYATRSSFIHWVDSYLFKAKPLPCTSLDLYAARCGLLHTYTPYSNLTAIGKARIICCAWGAATVQDLQNKIKLTNNSGKYAVVHIEELYEAWHGGVQLFVKELEKDLDKKASVQHKASKFFAGMTVEDIS